MISSGYPVTSPQLARNTPLMRLITPLFQSFSELAGGKIYFG